MKNSILLFHQIATAAQHKAIAEHLGDVNAGAEQVTAFQKAAQPVFDKLAKDLFNAESIAVLDILEPSSS